MAKVTIDIFDTPKGIKFTVNAAGSLQLKASNGTATDAEKLAIAICNAIFRETMDAARAEAAETSTDPEAHARIEGWDNEAGNPGPVNDG